MLESFILSGGKAGSKQKIFERIPVQNPMDHQAEFVPFKIDPIVPDPKAVQDFSGAFQFAEPLQIRAHRFLGQAAKLAQNVQLKILGHAGQLGCADRVEDDLKGTHLSLHGRVELQSGGFGTSTSTNLGATGGAERRLKPAENRGSSVASGNFNALGVRTLLPTEVGVPVTRSERWPQPRSAHAQNALGFFNFGVRVDTTDEHEWTRMEMNGESQSVHPQ